MTGVMTQGKPARRCPERSPTTPGKRRFDLSRAIGTDNRVSGGMHRLVDLHLSDRITRSAALSVSCDVPLLTTDSVS